LKVRIVEVLAGAKLRAGARWRATAAVGAKGADCAAVSVAPQNSLQLFERNERSE
jgi:hypothetical protein